MLKGDPLLSRNSKIVLRRVSKHEKKMRLYSFHWNLRDKYILSFDMIVANYVFDI